MRCVSRTGLHAADRGIGGFIKAYFGFYLDCSFDVDRYFHIHEHISVCNPVLWISHARFSDEVKRAHRIDRGAADRRGSVWMHQPDSE